MRLLASLLVCAFALPLQAEEKVLNLYNWADYVPQQALQRFQAETGIRVKYDSFDSTEVLESKLLTGGSGYDLVFPSSSVLGRAISAKALQPVGELANGGNLDPELLAKLAGIDPGNAYGVPYTWGTVGLGINREAVEQRLPGVALDSLDLLFKPEYASKLKDCGISVLDSPQEVIAVVLNYLGKAPYSTAEADREAAKALLAQLQLQVDIGIEMVFNGPLAVARDDEDFFDAALQGFFDDVLDRRFIDDRQHFLRRRLSSRQKTGAKTGGGDDGFTNLFHTKTPYSNQRDRSNSSPMISLTNPWAK